MICFTHTFIHSATHPRPTYLRGLTNEWSFIDAFLPVPKIYEKPQTKKKTWWEHSHHTSKKIFSLYLFLSFIFVSLLWSFAHKDKSTASSSSFLLLAPLSYSPVSPSQIIASLMASSWENLRPRFLLFRSLLLFLLLLIWSCLVCQKRPTKKSTTLLFFF